MPIILKTALNKFTIYQHVSIPFPPEFQITGEMTLLPFKFHSYFDGLIGMDLLSYLKTEIDLPNLKLKTPSTTIPLWTHSNLTSNIFNISGHTKNVLPLPVETKQGDFYIDSISINDDLIISDGIYNSQNNTVNFVITNYSDVDQLLYLESPIKSMPYSTVDSVELFNITPNSPKPQDSATSLQTLYEYTENLSPEERQGLLSLCKKFLDIFYKEDEPLTFTNKITHAIKTMDNIPIHTKSYRYPYIHKEEVKKQIESMLNQDIIKSSYSPWSAPVWVVPKKLTPTGEQKWRLVSDYRKLNEKTISDRYPIPNIADILDRLGKARYFSTLDLASGFHQIEMNRDDILKTAFTVEGGHYEFIRMPFGLKNAPATFQRVMDNIFGDLIGTICLVSLDDIIIFSTSLQDHLIHLKTIFERLRSANFKVQLTKSNFLRKETEFLGHIVSQECVKPNPNKIEAIKNFP